MVPNKKIPHPSAMSCARVGYPVRDGYFFAGGVVGLAGVMAGFADVVGFAGTGLGAGATGAGELLETVTDDLPTVTVVGAVLIEPTRFTETDLVVVDCLLLSGHDWVST
jgi:hypothetical protein